MILNFFTKYVFDYVMMLLIITNLSLRKYKEGQKKRFATILIALLILVVYLLLILIDTFSLPQYLEYGALLVGIVLAIVFRKNIWPFKRKCTKCGKKMSWDATLGRDDNLCDDCYYEAHPEEKKKKEEEERNKKGLTITQKEIEEKCINANKVDEVPWRSWEPTERCVLTYVFDDNNNVLLIYKKRGMGNGYYNAPGGHIEIEETKYEAAIRETKEETGLDISSPEEIGTLYFQFKDGTRMLGYVFTTHTFSGSLIEECDETKPFWCKIDELDYSKMWKDDILWLPKLLKGERFEGYFIFDDREMLDAKVVDFEE